MGARLGRGEQDAVTSESVANVLRRLRKLEARVTDGSGLVRHSAKWLDQWLGKVDAIIRGEEPRTLEVFRLR